MALPDSPHPRGEAAPRRQTGAWARLRAGGGRELGSAPGRNRRRQGAVPLTAREGGSPKAGEALGVKDAAGAGRTRAALPPSRPLGPAAEGPDRAPPPSCGRALPPAGVHRPAPRPPPASGPCAARLVPGPGLPAGGRSERRLGGGAVRGSGAPPLLPRGRPRRVLSRLRALEWGGPGRARPGQPCPSWASVPAASALERFSPCQGTNPLYVPLCGGAYRKLSR